MDWHQLLRPLYVQRDKLLDRVEQWPAEWATGLRIRLMRVEEVDLDQATPAPVVVALVGGTGVGKSSLFNALIDKPGASPVSHGKRGFTTTVIAAGPASLEPDASRLLGPDGKFVPCSGKSFLLLDMPDLDSVFEENRRTAEAVIRQADILIYVTSPDKRSDFRLLEEIRTWALQKRWFFVLNQADRLSEKDRIPAQEDLLSHLRRLGFPAEPADVWLVSTTQPEVGELPRFDQELQAATHQLDKRKLRVDSVLGQFQSAVGSPQERQALDQAIEKLCRRQAEFASELVKEVERYMQQPHVQQAFQKVVQQYLWAEAAQQAWCFLKIPFWLRARWAGVRAGWATASLAVRGLSLLRLLALVQGLVSLLREELAVRRLLDGLDAFLDERLTQQRAEARRLLRKLGLDRPDEKVSKSQVSPPAADPDMPQWRLQLDRYLARIADVGLGEDQMRGRVGQVLVEQAQQAARATVGAAMPPWVAGAAEVLPWIVFLHGLWRVAYSWWYAEWLGLPFLITWGCMLGAALLPGTVWVTRRIKKRSSHQSLQADWAKVLSTAAVVPWPELTRTIEELESVKAALEHIAVQACNLRSQLESQFLLETGRLPGQTAREARPALTGPEEAEPATASEPALSAPAAALEPPAAADGQPIAGE